jgi:hypothetical protein
MRMQSLAGAAVGHADEAAPVGSALAASGVERRAEKSAAPPCEIPSSLTSKSS